MKRLLLLLSVLVLGVSWAAAQYSSGQSPNSESAGQSNAAGETTTQGCLNGANGSFTLTDKDGNSYQLAGDTAKLSKHVGREVKVTGTAESASSPNPGGTATGTSANGASRTLQVNSVKHISKTCESAGMSK
jgi:hypothetical protein